MKRYKPALLFPQVAVIPGRIEAAAQDVVTQFQGVIVGIKAVQAQGFRQGDFILNPARIGDSRSRLVCWAAHGQIGFRLGAHGLPAAKVLGDNGSSPDPGVTLPITTIVARSGRKACW